MRLGAAKEARESAKCKSSQLFIRTHNETLDRRHDARQQSRSFAPQNQGLIHSPNSSQLS